MAIFNSYVKLPEGRSFFGVKSVVCVSPVFTDFSLCELHFPFQLCSTMKRSITSSLGLLTPQGQKEQGGSVRIPRKWFWGISGYRKICRWSHRRKSASLVLLKPPTEHSGTNPDPFYPILHNLRGKCIRRPSRLSYLSPDLQNIHVLQTNVLSFFACPCTICTRVFFATLPW